MTQRKRQNYNCGVDLCKDLWQAVVAFLKVLPNCLLTKMMRTSVTIQSRNVKQVPSNTNSTPTWLTGIIFPSFLATVTYASDIIMPIDGCICMQKGHHLFSGNLRGEWIILVCTTVSVFCPWQFLSHGYGIQIIKLVCEYIIFKK